MAVFPNAVQYIFVADVIFIKTFNPVPLSLLSRLPSPTGNH